MCLPIGFGLNRNKYCIGDQNLKDANAQPNDNGLTSLSGTKSNKITEFWTIV